MEVSDFLLVLIKGWKWNLSSGLKNWLFMEYRVMISRFAMILLIKEFLFNFINGKLFYLFIICSLSQKSNTKYFNLNLLFIKK